MAFEYVNLKDIDKEVLEGYNLKPENQSYQGVDLQPGEMKTNEFKFDYSDNGNYFGVNKAELEEATAISKQVQTDFAHDNLIHTSNVYRKYFANNEENLRVAKSINAEIPVLTVEQITNSPEDLNSAVEKLNRKHKIEALLPEGEKDLALSRLYEEYPDIFKLNDVDAAIALHNIENVKVTKGIIESAMLGYDAWKANDERNKIGNKGYRFGDITAEDKQRLKELREKSKEMALNMPDFIDNPLAAIAAGTMQNVPMIVSEFGEAQLVAIPAAMVTAGGTFAATKDPVKAASMGKKAYNIATKVAMGVDMFNDIVGNYYLDYIEYQDRDGKQLLTNNEARLAATLAAAAETYLEIGNFDKVVDLLKNKPGGAEATEVLAGIVANTKEKASIKAQIAYFLQNRFGKAAGVFKGEIVEEFNQSLSSDTVHNIFAMYKPGGNLEVIPIAEMGSNAVESAVEAGPAVAGMTVGGKVISRTTIGKVLNKTELGSAIGVSSIVKQYASAVQEKISDAASIQNNVAGQIMIEKLTENKKDNKLAKESPDIYNQLLTNQVQGTRYENVVVDSELLTGNGQDKEGTEIYYQLAGASGKTREEAEQMLELGTPLQVPMAKYVEAVEDNNIREKLKNYISFDVNEGSFARIKEMAVDMEHKLDRIYAKDWKGQIETVQNFVDTEFQDEQERAVANQILMEYTNLSEGVKALRQEYQGRLDDLINPVVETMREGMKQGVDLVAKDDNGYYDIEGEGHIGGYGMISNNAPWYRNYYKENKKAPSEKQMRELARSALLGDNPYGIPAGSSLTSGVEARETDQYYQDQFNNIESVLDTLDKIEPVMNNLDVSDLVAMEGLSKEGVEVFKTVKKYLKDADSKKSKEAAAASAAVVAHHADVMAENHRKMGDTNYTALDYMRSLGFGYGESMNGNVLNQITNIEFAPWYDGPNRKLDLDTEIEAIDLSSRFEGMNWEEAVETFTNEVKDFLASTENLGSLWESIENEQSNAEIIWPKASVEHSLYTKNSHSEEDADVLANRQDRLHYEVMFAIREALKRGILIEEHPDKHAEENKIAIEQGLPKPHKHEALRGYRLFAPVRLDKKHLLTLRLLVLRIDNKYKLATKEITDLNLHDHTVVKVENINDVEKENKKEPFAHSLTDAYGERPEGSSKDPFNISIRQMLTNVNDLKGRAYINDDGSGNFEFALDTRSFGPYKNRIDYEAKKQFKETKDKYRKSKEYLKSPNGERTKLERNQWIIVRTPLFKQWFGDWENGEVPKELLDENGEPKIFYHQTANEFDTFDVRHRGAGSTDDKTPFGVFLKPNADDIGVSGNIQMPLFVRMHNPIKFNNRYELKNYLVKNVPGYAEAQAHIDSLNKEFKDKFEAAEAEDRAYIKSLTDSGMSRKEAAEEYYKRRDAQEEIMEQWDAADIEARAKAKELVDSYFRKQGYDGVILVKDQGSFGRSVSTVIALDNNQVKSATDNNGNFDINNPNIYMQTKADITDTPFFRQWFGESKTVDENGQPLVFYHGTATPNITEFKHSKAQDKAGREMAMGQGKGKFYFATTEMAANAAAQGAMWRGQGKNPTVMPVYLKLENPVDLQTYKDRYQELSGHDLNEGYSDGYTMKDRDKFIAKLDKQLQKEGVDGILDKGYGFAAVFNANQIKSTENQGTFDSANNNIYMQQGEEKDLVAYHNITGQDLQRAIEFGGFPVPSIAIMKKDVAYDKYGEITLVGNKDMIDPKRGVPVYSKDGYTITFPKPSYAVPKIGLVRKFKEKWQAFFNSIDDAYSIDRITDEYRNPERMADNLRNSFGFQYYYLTKVLGKNIEIPVNEYIPRMPILKDDTYFKKLYDVVENVDKYEDLDTWEKDIGAVVEEFYDDRIAKAKLQGIKKKLIELKAEVVVDGVVNDNELNKIFKEFEEYKKTKAHPGKDYRALKDKVRTEYNDIIYGNEYYKWVDEQIKELVGEGKVKIGNKLYPFTLENVTRYMVKNAGAAAEESFTFSAGKVAAIASQKFKSIDEMHAAEHKLGTDEEFNKTADAAKEIGNRYRSEIAKYQKFASEGIFTAFDDAMEALAKASDSKGYTTIDKLRTAIKRNGGFVDDIPNEVLQLGVDYLKALTDTTTQYFEAKPQRAIHISEFAGAVVPSDADPNLVKQLTDAGLVVETYEPGDNTGRQEATQRIQQQQDVLFQKQSNVQGYAEINAKGQRIVNLLQAADQSTFMHEMAHIFYDDLKQLAQDPRATEQMARDWNTLYDWASWNADQIKEYEGTASYKEFAKRNAEILEAQEKGYVIRDGRSITLEKLLNEWAQERFARGFEVYLQEGKAPSKPLQRAFAKFKQWLMKIYKACTGAGAKPSKEVKAVMDRMIATQEEIDNAMTIANIEGLEKQGLFRYLSDTSQEMWERNLENIREDVSKKVMKLAMRDMTDKAKEERAEALKKEREAAYERISQEPIFVAWKFLQQNPNLSTSDVVEQFANMTVKEYTEQLRALGGSLDGAVDQYMEMYERNLPQVTNEEIRAAAKEAVTNSYYTKLAEAFELQALEQYVRDEQRLSKKLAKIEAKDEAERKEAEAAIRQLDYRQRQQEERDRNVRALRAETKENERLQERISNLELQILDLRKQKADIRREFRTDREARLKEVREQKQKVIDEKIQKLEEQKKLVNEERKRFRLFEQTEGKGKRIYRDALDNYVQNIEKYAEKKMAALPISEATNPAMWARMAENYTNTSLELFARGEYELAARQKRIAFFYRQMAELAEKNRKKVDKRTTALMAHSRTMLKNKNVAANDRYLYNHLMYNFGLANRDALVPPGYPASYMDVLLTYDENLELNYVDQDGNIDLPDWLTGAMGTEAGRYKEGEGYHSLRMDQMELLYSVMNNIYKAGSEAKKLKTTRDAHGNVMDVADVVGEIVGNAMGNIPVKTNEDVTGAGNETTWEAWKRRANEAHVALLKPETILRQLGDSAIKYIYNPIKLAADNEMMETELLAGKIRGMTEAYRDGIALMYKNQGHENYEQMADKAMADLRTKKKYKLGTSLLTKENVLVLAFNWGTFVNRKRVMDGYNVTQAQVENVLAELDSADWQLVINVWDLFNDYWPRLQEVEANISGVVLEKQEAVPFTIVDKTGFTYNLGGGYYPIKYDRVKNIRIGDHAQDETARLSMAGMTRFGIGLGNTKERMETVPYKLRNDFGVIQEALTDTLHNICMRETVRDVNRIIRDPDFSQFMGEYYGNATVKMLENWILDCWAKEPQQKDFMEKAAQWIRQKQTVAALGFRTTTALLNVCNLPYVIDYLGAGRTMSALKNFYAHPQAQFDLCMEKSIFLRERAETMDRDMGDVLKRNRANPGDKIMNAIEEKAFWFISRTDLMLACPMWVSEYERAFQEAMDNKMSPEQAEREAVLAGDAAVRRTFGSGQIQDLAAVQKGSEFTKTFTMYYSFFSVVHNALMMKVFEARQASFKKEELAKRLQPIAEGVLFWIIIPSAMEACIRAAASGDDKDKEARNVAKKFLATTAGTMVGGIPLLRDTIPAYLEWAMGGRYFGVSGTPIGDTADQVQRIMSGIKSGKKTKLDVLRDVAAVTSSISGLPKTMLDGMITAMQFIDHGKMTADDIMHYLWAIAFDKNPDKKK